MQDYKNINFHCANEGRLKGEKNKRIEDFLEICAGEEDRRPLIKILLTKYFVKIQI